MKIVDVCAFYAPGGGGVRTYVDRKLAAAAARGHEMIVIAPGQEDAIEVRGPASRIRWLRSPSFPLDRTYRYFADRRALHAALGEERPDIVEVSSPWRSASMVADWPGDARRALIAHADPLSAYAYRWFGGVADRATIDRAFDWYWRHLRRLDTRFDMVVSASESLSQRLREGGLRTVVTNPMGVEAGLFSPSLRDEGLRADLLARCGLPPHATLLIGVGRHALEKRWPMLARATTRAAAQVPVGLVIVGDGHARRSAAQAVGENPHIRLLAPIRDRARLARLMASADALIHGCEAETFCFAAAEAIASGLPVIAPDLGGAGDHARRAGGLLYRSADEKDAADAIVRFARERDRIARPASPIRTMDQHFDDLFLAYAGAPRSAAA
ncbi:glycosyltransferase [Sphingomonas naphthae]|uniref:Glycosyltransferase n=1 Tax=Sphingomonas naphthae TaxID=1813468 RepID=A0ABY7TG56_9SPHN|nr:glycosyltransferase [Sphingomonas naphthae]WCT72211.1 glycosyltransferase [Sphingomonas naphthae]